MMLGGLELRENKMRCHVLVRWMKDEQAQKGSLSQKVSTLVCFAKWSFFLFSGS